MINVSTICFYITIFCIALSSCACNQYPISVSNITSCVDNQCFYPQLATTSVGITDGQEICFEFLSTTNSSDQFSLQITILESISTFPTTDCYFTDDMVFSSSVLCNCPLGGGSSASCPCAASDTPFRNNQFCVIGTTSASGCPFGRTADYCAKVGVSGLPRYRVCTVSKDPLVSITASVFDTYHNDTNLVYLTNTNMFYQEPAGKYNLTFSNINVASNNPGDFQILDTSTDQIYYLSSAECNNKYESDPFKFGAIKVNNDSSLTISNEVKRAITVDILDCASDSARVINPIPALLKVNHNAHIREADALPMLQTGLIWYNLVGDLNYIGVNMDGDPIIGAPYHIWSNTTWVDFNFVGTSAINHASFPGNSTIPYWNASECTGYIVDSFTIGILGGGWVPGFISCPTVKYPVLFQDLYAYGAPDPHAACVGDHEIALSYCFSLLDAPLYPNIYTRSQICMSTDWWFINLGVYAPRMRSVNTDIVVVNRKADAILSVYYNSYSVQFTVKTVKPIITNIDYDDVSSLITVKAKSISSPGTCYLYTKPPITDQISLSLTNALSETQMSAYDISFTGDVTFFIECGYSRTNKTERFSMKPQSSISSTVKFFDDLKSKAWFPYTAVSIGIALTTMIGFIVYKVLTRKSMSRPKYANMHSLSSKNK